MKFGISVKLAFLLAVVGTVAAGSTGFYAYRASRELLVQSAKEELTTATQVLVRRITQTRQEVTRNLQLIVMHTESLAVLERADPAAAERLATFFTSLMHANPSYLQIRLIAADDNGKERVRVDRDVTGPVRIPSADLQEKGHYAYVFDTLTLPSGAFYLSRIAINHEIGAHAGLGQPTVQLATPLVGKNGRKVGIAVISVDLNNVFALLRADLPEDFLLFFANGEGDFLIHPDPERTFGFDKGRRFLVQDEFPATRALLEKTAAHVLVDADSGRYAEKPVVAAFSAQKYSVVSGETGAILGLAQPLDKILKQADRLGIITAQIVASLSFAAILLAIALGRIFTRPINAMSQAVQSFTGGNAVGDLPLHREDEIGVLARSFERMRGQIGQQLAELETKSRELKQFAFYDVLTGLPNRRLMLDRLQQTLAACERHRRYGALMLLDLDNFKTLNDSLGHDAGDQLLIEVAQRIKLSLRHGDTVARLGGDEFVLILEDLDSDGTAAMQAEIVATKIQRSLCQPYAIQVRGDGGIALPRSHHCTPSIGIALFCDTSVAPEELLKRADTAMYQAKAAGRDTLRFFDQAMQAAVSARSGLENDLRQAIAAEQFVVAFQGQADSRGRIFGAEVLLRWQHPERGLIAPADFIPLAEETGLILQIGHWVMQTACAQLARWAESPEFAPLSLAVNVSARQFGQANFAEQVLFLLKQNGVSPGKLKLELTESMLLHHTDDVIRKMTILKDSGIGFSLDDFGTGYSSLSYLKRLPLDQLKIDQSFVRDVLTDPNDAAIARTVIALGQALDLSVIAEGVEKEEQVRFLSASGCRYYQGFFLGRPLPLAEFEALVRENSRQFAAD